MHYGNQWRTFRRLIHQHLTESVVDSEHLRIVDAEAVQLVRDYIHYPEDHMLHPKRFSNSVTNSIGEYLFRSKRRERIYLVTLKSFWDSYSRR